MLYRHNKKEQDQLPAHTYQRDTKRQKEIECPHPTLRLVKNTRYDAWKDNLTCVSLPELYLSEEDMATVADLNLPSDHYALMAEVSFLPETRFVEK